jgi:alkanesulfonate monooxygenase SsuD/methylene tetrahydromethanopterin reductase-like flavin-dependent oxidoreductase (luciferase family)
VYRNDLRLGDMYEPLGFDSLWSVEHHFDDYTMCPDVLQFLTYYAGRTKNIQLGPWLSCCPGTILSAWPSRYRSSITTRTDE